MTPAFRLMADAIDVSATIADRLVELEITDEDGRSADVIRLTIDDRDDAVELPGTGAALELWLGLGAPLVFMGRYVVDAVSGSAPPRTVTITGTAADMAGPLRAPRTRSWEDVTLADIVSTIAGEAGLTPAVDADLAGIHYPLEVQRGESDLALLGRLAADLDATAKPAAGRLVVVRRDTGRNAEGEAMPPVPLEAARFERWDWEIEEREAYASVEAEWGDLDAAEVETVTAGSGAPVRRLRHRYAGRAEAERAAAAELGMAGRRRITFRGDMAGFAPDLFAGGHVELGGVKAGIDGRYLVRSVTHRLDTSLRTSLGAERAADD